ncbi:MAG: FAD-dependent thymidylate synthase [Patescibacteria group bacterium]
MEVKLIAKPDTDILSLMSKAARTCYEPEEPTGDKTIDIEHKIFPVGHFTILQHPCFTFFIEGIPVGNITLGLHLNMIFNTSSQRSGRYCFGMFSDLTAIDSIMAFIREFYPDTTDQQHNQIRSYIKHAQKLFSDNIEAGTDIAAKFIAEERPKATDKYIKQNAKKFAQEQLRMLVPVIFPTAITFTINLSTLIALYRVAWDPVMLRLTEMMTQQILAIDPTLAYAFKRLNTELNWAIPATISHDTYPTLKLRQIDSLDTAVYPSIDDTHPVDTLYFNPKFMPNNDIHIKTKVHISLATMGQDQRHRRINRGPFKFTGYMYCPPILAEQNLKSALITLGQEWVQLSTDGLHPALASTLAPYGAMVEYTKSADLNALMHEQDKRLCWCTQEEIYWLSCRLREEAGDQPVEFLTQLSPPCFKSGICGEGARYCGRDLTINHANFFPHRKV